MIVRADITPTESRLTAEGEAELILFLGHGEYALPEVDDLEVEAWDEYDEQPAPMPEWLSSRKDELAALGYDCCLDEGWGTAVKIGGDLRSLRELFFRYALAVDPTKDPLRYGLGGDDNAFDYFPSAMHCLRELADDLDSIDPQSHREHMIAYGEVFLNTMRLDAGPQNNDNLHEILDGLAPKIRFGAARGINLGSTTKED